MDSALTVRDLLLPGGPLYPAEVVAGQTALDNPVAWVVSLRPYPPAFPRLRGGELALVAVEFLSRLEPPTTLSDVLRQLSSRGVAGVAVRGEIDAQAARLAAESGLPTLLLPPDAPLHDIEQAVMRECALHQARREILPAPEPGAWVDDLLAGRIGSYAEAQSLARRHGQKPASHYSVLFVMSSVPGRAVADEHTLEPGRGGQASPAGGLVERFHTVGSDGGLAPPARAWHDGLAVLLPRGETGSALAALSDVTLPVGIGEERPLLEVHHSLAEAETAAVASALLEDCKPVRYSHMGADRLLVLLYREHPAELRAFVGRTLGPLLSHDKGSAAPLLPTLYSFVAHGGRLRETAADIYVHRNTLAYRLDRAAEILGADLRDPPTRLTIETALRALPLVNALPPE